MDFMGSDIYEAVRQGDVVLLRVAIENLGRPDITLFLTPQKNTALHIAATFGREEMATELIDMSQSLVCLANSKGDTPIHTAARAGDINLTKVLANAVGDMEPGLSGEVWRMRNLEGNTAMHEALKKGHEEVALYLLGLDRKQQLGLAVNDSGESTLYIAAEAGLTEFVLELVEGANYSVQGPDGLTPLHIAVIRGHLEIVEILMQKSGAIDPKKVDCFGKTILHYAATLGHTAISYKILKAVPSLVYVLDKDRNSPLHIAAIRGTSNQMVKDTLDSSPCAAELVDGEGRNALHLAVINGNTGMLRFMLKCPVLKALINEPDNHGDTPLHLSAKIPNLGIVTLLLRARADVRATNKENLTARDICANFKKKSLAELELSSRLIKFGAPYGRRVLVQKKPTSDPRGLHANRSLANTISVVATLVATVSFAAAFTLPGGLMSDGPDEGVPVLQSTAAFKVFVVSDTVAFTSSICVALLMFFFFFCPDRFFLATGLDVGIAISCWLPIPATGIAFLTGLYVLLSKRAQSLTATVLCIGGGLPFFFLSFWIYRNRKRVSRFTPKYRG